MIYNRDQNYTCYIKYVNHDLCRYAPLPSHCPAGFRGTNKRNSMLQHYNLGEIARRSDVTGVQRNSMVDEGRGCNHLRSCFIAILYDSRKGEPCNVKRPVLNI